MEEIITCSNGSDSKLLELLLQLKHETDTNTDEVKSSSLIKENEADRSENSATSTNCVARGTGLMVGFVGRAANFIVFYASMSDLDLVVEIKGPCDTICTERITKRSPKKKQILKPWKPASPHNVARSSSNEERNPYPNKKDTRNESEDETRYMPLEYEIHSNRIYFAYMPLIKGDHQIKILSQGIHVSDSPYTVAVGPVVGAHKNIEIGRLKPSLKVENECDHTEHRKVFVRFQEPNERKERLGKIIKRRVLRYIVKIDSKDIVVDTDSIDNLATSLLKMDYEFQKPPLSRRNSWGFVGDAERKVSVIRQFCVNMDELEAQSVKLHRSHSLSTNSKRAFNRSGSYECEDIQQQKKLETVTEGTVSHFETNPLNKEAEAALVYFNEDFENDAEYSKNDQECLVKVNKQISDPKHDSIEDFIELTSTVNDYVDSQNWFYRCNAEETLNSMKNETETCTQISNINKEPLDHLPRASEISGRHVDQINKDRKNFEILNNFKKTSPDLNEIESQDGLVQNIKSIFENIEYMPLTETISLAENNKHNSNVDETNEYYKNTVSKQKDLESLKENDIFDEVFIEEELCTKIDIRKVDQSHKKRVEIEKPCNDPKSNFKKPEKKSNSIKCLTNSEGHCIESKTETFKRRDILKEPRVNRRSRRFHYKKTFPNHKMYKKKVKRNQRNSSQKFNRPLLNFPSSCNQNSNNSKRIEEYSNQICTKDNAKPENLSLSSNKNSVQMRNFDKVNFVHDLRDSRFSYSQKRFQRNYSKFLVNNLKADNKPNCLDIKIDATKENKITSNIIKIVKLPHYGKINLNNKVCLNKSHLGESDVEISSLSQINGHISENNLQKNFTTNPAPTSVAFCQLNFRHFNPTLPNKRTSFVRNRINQWERTVFKEDFSSESKNNSPLISKLVNISSRLNFWETVTKENNSHQKFHITKNSNCKDIQGNVTDTTRLISTGICKLN